jgi:hypothetical protein
MKQWLIEEHESLTDFCMFLLQRFIKSERLEKEEKMTSWYFLYVLGKQ